MNAYAVYVAAHTVDRSFTVLDGQVYAIVKSQAEFKHLAYGLLYNSLYAEVRASIEYSVLRTINSYIADTIEDLLHE